MPQQICFPNHEGQPFQPDPPLVDGYVEPEPGMEWVFGSQPSKVDIGWTGAGRQTFGDATEVDIATPLAVLQGVRHASQPKLFLSFIVRRDVSFDQLDRVILVFHPDFAAGSVAKTGDERRIDIQPVTSGVGAGTAAPNEADPWGLTVDSEGFRTDRPPLNIETYRWDTGSDSWQSTGTPTGLDVKVRSWDSGTNNRNWSLEVEVPTTVAAGGADWIELTSSIGFFADLVRVTQGQPLGLDFVTQFVWPRGAELDDQGGILDVHQIPIEPSKLGQAFVGNSSVCASVRGVRFESTWGSVGARTPGSGVDPGSAIVNAQNEFVARVVNDGADAADGVRADFRIANWGIGPGDSPLWNRLSADSGFHNPTPGQTIAGGTPGSPTSAELTTRWTPPAGQYGSTLHPHQCIWVLLDSSSDVSFVRASAKRNMDIVGLSESETEAAIDGRGWADGDEGPGDLEFLLLESHLTLTREADPIVIESERNRPEREKPDPSNVRYEQRFITIIDGYRRTSRTLTLGGNRLPIYSYTDSFGQIGVHHTTRPDDLEVGLDGPTVEPRGPGGYLVPVPQDGAVTLTVRMRTVERPTGPDLPFPRPEPNWLLKLLQLLLELLKRLFRRGSSSSDS